MAISVHLYDAPFLFVLCASAAGENVTNVKVLLFDININDNSSY